MRSRLLTTVSLSLTLLAAIPSLALAGRADDQFTTLVSRSTSGGVPNGPSTNAVISMDRRYGQVIVFESTASNLVAGDGNGYKDVFAIKRAGGYGNNGSVWRPGPTKLISRPAGGGSANGDSYGAAVDGDFIYRARCVAFVSEASNLVRGDGNGYADAFVSEGPGGAPKLISKLPNGRQVGADVTQVAVSGGCTAFAWVAGGKLYFTKGGKTTEIKSKGAPKDPSFAVGKRLEDVVFGDRGGAYISRGGKKPSLIAAGASDPAASDIPRSPRNGGGQLTVYAYVKGGQVYRQEQGKGAVVVSKHGSSAGNGPSSKPTIGNAGFYVAFESDASNLGTNSNKQTQDGNGEADAYLYTDTRKITLVQSVEQKGKPVPGGGRNPSMSYYANYFLFDSPAPLSSSSGDHQVFMRYLGEV